MSESNTLEKDKDIFISYYDEKFETEKGRRLRKGNKKIIRMIV